MSPLTATVVQLLLGVVATAVPFAVGVLWQARTTRYWRDRAYSAERRRTGGWIRAEVPVSDLPHPALLTSTASAAALRRARRA